MVKSLQKLLNFYYSLIRQVLFFPILQLDSSVQSLSCVQLFATPWTAACHAPLHHQLPEFTQTHIHWVGDAIQPSHSLSSPSPPTFNISQHHLCKADTFEIWWWRRLLIVPLTARWSNQWVLKDINHEYALERLRAEGEVDDREWDGWMASLTQWTWVWASSKRWWRTEKPGVLQSMGPQRLRYDWVIELNWILLRVLLWWWGALGWQKW